MNSMATGFEVQNSLLHGPTGNRLVNAGQREKKERNQERGSGREIVNFNSA